MGNSRSEHEGLVITDTRRKTEEPPMYKVLLLNDDYTTMDFVIMILEVVFYKDTQEAARIMLQVHRDGKGVAGIFTRDVAETKVAIVHDLAHKNDHPLKCSIEEA
ncbi:MAG: ATP-dependent Clp protease adapter ClpS [Desulfurivibrionaceae bacterium]|nr:ATP-dependent Clp protease adapter ClpS [Desulfobulbales bacterium]MDT8334162.1 ATP-dependent Clp protease adapter ClpS [Desulfurivibrionaceae bacterium]